MLINFFIIFAMVFFVYVEARFLCLDKVHILEKLGSFVVFSIIELYYILQLLERLRV